ncbi:hypothetical protein [Oricola indica]|uniref:hypothetical protein n=1 Tax=Oricola indica TaxID=2872591 RepID=UPI003CCBC26C
MPNPLIKSVLSVFLCLAASGAFACEFRPNGASGPEPAATLDMLPEGIVSGTLRCGARAHAALVWTLGVDGGQENLGVRDDKLFEIRHTGPLNRLMAAHVEDHAHITVFERSETVKISSGPLPEGRFSIRRFFTFCDIDHAADPLDCSIGKARIKGRRTAQDTNKDGYLDISEHEISYYDGDSKLHVLSFATPYGDSLTADAGLWIEAVNAVSDVLKPRELASAE